MHTTKPHRVNRKVYLICMGRPRDTRGTGYSVSRWDLSLGTVGPTTTYTQQRPPDKKVTWGSAQTAKRGASGLKAAVRGLVRFGLRPGETGGMRNAAQHATAAVAAAAPPSSLYGFSQRAA